MNDKEIADKVVALGVGWIDDKPDQFGETAWADGTPRYVLRTGWHGAQGFVNDWRVAGALMEKAQSEGFTISEIGRWVQRYATDKHDWPRAIVEACVEVLGE